MGVITASTIFYYMAVPKRISNEPEVDTIITSDNLCDLLFIQKALKINSHISIGNSSSNVKYTDKVLNVHDICRSQEYYDNGGFAYDSILESFNTKPRKSSRVFNAIYKRHFKEYYSQYYNKLSAKQKQDVPKAIFYNAFSKTVDEYISSEMKRGHIVVKTNIK